MNLCQEPPVSAGRAGGALAGHPHPLRAEALPAQQQEAPLRVTTQKCGQKATVPAGQEALAAGGAHTPPAGTAGIPQPRWDTSRAPHPGISPAPGQQPPPSSLPDRALTSWKSSQPLISSVNMQIADGSWAGRVVGTPGDVQNAEGSVCC